MYSNSEHTQKAINTFYKSQSKVYTIDVKLPEGVDLDSKVLNVKSWLHRKKLYNSLTTPMSTYNTHKNITAGIGNFSHAEGSYIKGGNSAVGSNYTTVPSNVPPGYGSVVPTNESTLRASNSMSFKPTTNS